MRNYWPNGRSLVLQDFLDSAVRENHDHILFCQKTRYRTFTWTYGEFGEYVHRVAGYFHGLGVGPGDKVIIYAPNSVEWAAAFFATAAIGAITVPIDLLSDNKYISAVQNQVKAKVSVSSKYRPANAAGAHPVYVESLFETVKDMEMISRQKLDALRPSENDLLELVYTSGTTGDPKGVMLTHANVLSNVNSLKAMAGIEQHQKFLSILPMSHMFEMTVGFLLPMSLGSTIVHIHTRKPSVIKKTLKEDEITGMVTVPAFLEAIYNGVWQKARQAGKEKKLEFMLKLAMKIAPSSPRIRRLICRPIVKGIGDKMKLFGAGGSALDPVIADFFRAAGYEVLTGYGLTETSPVIALSPCGEAKRGTVGIVLSNVHLRIADDGEILVKGPSVTQGYYLNPEKTKEAFNEDGWFLTGDIGEVDEDGYVTIKDRKKDMILSGSGLNVYPVDIEQKLNNTAGVVESAVVGLDLGAGVEIHTVILPDGEMTPEAADKVIEEVNRQLQDHQKIMGYTLWPESEFPKTPTRKIKKKLVLEYLVKKAEGEEKASTGADDAGKDLPRLYHLISEISKVAVTEIAATHALYSDLGIDSLGRLELAAAIEEEMDIEVDETALGPDTTVEQLDELINGVGADDNSLPMTTWQYRPLVRFASKIFVRVVLNNIVRFFCRPKYKGVENLDGIGQCMYIANHVSALDIPVINLGMPRRLQRMYAVLASAKVVFGFGENRFFQRLLKRYVTSNFVRFAYGLLPLPDSGVKKSFQFTGKIIDQGFSAFIFPEGARTHTGEMGEFKSGTAFLVQEMNLPVVPIRIDGLFLVLPIGNCIPKRGHVTITYGKPMYFKESDTVQDITERFKKAIEDLEEK